MRETPDLLSLFTRRASVLETVRDIGPISKRDLATHRDVSRSTIDRAVRELESAGLVRRAGGDVEITLPGSVALDAHIQHAARLRGVEAAYDMLATYEADLDLAPVLFEDATIVEPDRHAPHRPVSALVEMLEGTDKISLYATGIMPEYVEAYRDRVLDGATLELICTEDVLQELLSAYDQDLATAMETGRVHVNETSIALPFSLILTEQPDGQTDVCLMFYRDHAVAGFVRNDTPGAVDWGRDRFESLLADADSVDAPVSRL